MAELAQQVGAERAAADDHRALLQPPGAHQKRHELRQDHALDGERAEADEEPGRHPDARQRAVELEEEHPGEDDEKRQGPAAGDAEQRARRVAERRRAEDMQRLEDDDRHRRDADRHGEIAGLGADVAHDVEEVDRDAGQNDQRGLDRPDDAGDDDPRHGRSGRFGCDPSQSLELVVMRVRPLARWRTHRPDGADGRKMRP